MCLVLDGEFEERGSRGHAMRPGTLRASPRGDQHDLRFSAAGAHCLLIVVDETITDDAPLPAGRRFLRTPGQDIVRSIRAGLHDPLGSPLAVELHVLELLARIAATARPRQVTGAPPGWLLRVRDAIQATPHVTPTTASLAVQAGLHPVYVARAFRRWFGCSITNYLRTIRLDRARRLLLDETRSLARIAAETGFADQSHLTRLLSKRTGVTPAALRRALLEQVSSVQDLPAHVR